MNEPIENMQYVCSECSNERHKKWQKENKNTLIMLDGFCKISFVDGDNVEHMWLQVVEIWKDGTILGRLDNIPILVTNVEYGKTYKFKRSDISEYIEP